MARRKKNVRPSVRKGNNSSVMRVVVFLLLVALVVWYLVKVFARRIGGASASSAGGFLSNAKKGLGVEVVPQGVTQIEGLHGYNNPGNITYNAANDWQGQKGYNVRTIGGRRYEYVNFDSLYSGIRALFICVNNVYERMFGVDLATGVNGRDYLTFCEQMSPKVSEFYEEYSGTAGTGKSCESVFRSMVETTDEPLTALCMAVYRMEAGANYDVPVMDEIAKFQFQRVF